MSSIAKGRKDQEVDFLAEVDEIEKSASISVDTEFTDDADDEASNMDRMVAKDEEESPDPKSEEDLEIPTAENRWQSKPSVPDQFIKHNETIRGVNPTTVVLDLREPGDLDKLNEIQNRTVGDNPTAAIMVMERQQFEGSWSVYLTYETIEYQKL